ncbi:MAG: T9SS type A sorting domain-containing protein [Chlorobiota bacterium]
MRKSILFALLCFAELLVLLFPSKSFGQCFGEEVVYPFSFKGRNYEYVHIAYSSTSARYCAEQRGGYLVDIETKEENDFFVSFVLDTLKNKYNIDFIEEDFTSFWTGGRAEYVPGSPTYIEWFWKNEPYNRFHNFLGSQTENTNGRDLLNFSDTLYLNWGLINGVKQAYAFPTDYKTPFFDRDIAVTLVQIQSGTDIHAEVGNWITRTPTVEMPFIIDYGCIDSIKTTLDTLHCTNTDLILNGQEITSPGEYKFNLKSYSECDSLVTYNVSFTEIDTNMAKNGTNLVYGDNNADSYKWYRCDLDQLIEGEKSSFLKITESGSYRLEAEKGGCTFISDCYDYCIPVTTSIDTVKCSNESITINGEVYAERGFYTQKLSQVGFDCDSTLEIEIEDIYINTDIKKNGNQLSAVQTDAVYQWYNCDGDVMIEGANSQTFSLTESGEYKVEITKDGCIEYSECFEYTDAASVKDINESDMFTIDYKNGTIALNNTKKYTQIELLDLNAKTIFKSNELTQSIDISSLPSGIYFIKLQSNSKIEMFKFMVGG